MVKTSGPEATRGNRIGVELLQSPITRELSLFVLSGGSLEDLIASCLYLNLICSSTRTPPPHVCQK